jgi:predicted RNA-binding protein YlqC (UPF0109 family)
MKDLAYKIVTALVDYPEEVTVTEIEGSQSIVIEIAVAKDDIGKIIGKQGKTAMALRTLINAAAGKQRKHIILEILE